MIAPHQDNSDHTDSDLPSDDARSSATDDTIASTSDTDEQQHCVVVEAANDAAAAPTNDSTPQADARHHAALCIQRAWRRYVR